MARMSIHHIDHRLGNVFYAMIARMSDKNTVCLRRMSASHNEEVQFERFLGNKRVGIEALKSELYRSFGLSCPSSGHVFLIEDTTQIGFHLARKMKGLGPVGKGDSQGFYMHPLLCMDAVDGACYGVCGLEIYQRAPYAAEYQLLSKNERQALRNKQSFEEKESYRWYKVVEESSAHLPADIGKAVVADRESGIYSVPTGISALGFDYLIRARHDRHVLGGKRLSEDTSTWPSHHAMLELPATDGRSIRP